MAVQAQFLGTHQSVGFGLPGDAALNHGILGLTLHRLKKKKTLHGMSFIPTQQSLEGIILQVYF